MKRLESLSIKKYMLLLFCFTFAVCSVIMYCAPFISDDFEFSSYDFSSLKETADYSLHYGNGRFLGNLTVVYLCSNTLLRVFVKALFVSILIVILPYSIGIENKLTYLLSFLLVLGICPIMFSQVYTWTAGFENYIPPIVILLFCFLLFKADTGSAYIIGVLKSLSIFILSFCGQLFIEHISILNVIIALLSLVYALKYSHKRIHLALLWLFGAILGGIVMIAIPNIYEASNPFQSMYRKTYFNDIPAFMQMIYQNLLELISYFADSVIFCIVIGISAFLILLKSEERWKHPFLNKLAKFDCLALLFISIFHRTFFYYYTLPITESLFQIIFAIICIGFFVVCFSIAAHFSDKKQSRKIIILLVLAVIAFGPVVAVNPIGQRCAHLGYTLLSVVAMLFADSLVDEMDTTKKLLIENTAALSVIILSLGLLLQFYNMKYVDNIRTDYILQQMDTGAEQIEIFQIPSEYTFSETTTMIGMHYYYNEKDDIKFTFTDYNSWLVKREIEANQANKLEGK